MKYTVGSIFRLFQVSNLACPHSEFVIVDRLRLTNQINKAQKDLYRIKYTLTPYDKTEVWLSERDIALLSNEWWYLEVYDG